MKLAEAKTNTLINISAAYVAADGRSYYQALRLAAGSTVMDALSATGWLGADGIADLADFRQWCASHQRHDTNHKAWYVGIFSQKVRLDAVLHEGDRVEIYRPLALDPMGKRRTKLKKPKAGRQLQ